jgi:hypothetical protein
MSAGPDLWFNIWVDEQESLKDALAGEPARRVIHDDLPLEGETIAVIVFDKETGKVEPMSPERYHAKILSTSSQFPHYNEIKGDLI